MTTNALTTTPIVHAATAEVTDHTIRTVTINGQPWFVAADVCRVLSLGVEKGQSKNLHYLQADEKAQLTPGQIGGKGMSHATIISESGLYKLVMRSDKPQARAFQDWVTREVLPAVRKDGAYIMGEEKVRTGELSEDELVLKAIGILTKKVERLTEERAQLEAKVAEDAPKVGAACQPPWTRPLHPSCRTAWRSCSAWWRRLPPPRPRPLRPGRGA